MRTRLTSRPDQDGAKHLREQYRERLVCVRYRYDETKRRRWKTVELIVEESDWEPPRRQEDTLVAIQVAAQERGVRQQVKAAGGKWNPRSVVWELPYGQVVALGLTDRIVTKAEGREAGAHLQIDGPSRERPSTCR
ncbi:MAG: hypothetical protein HY268_29555 [Deltaproteobacteria bacterium]|nr:hypothetical protein [Deltaproteobacteria bacterium]